MADDLINSVEHRDRTGLRMDFIQQPLRRYSFDNHDGSIYGLLQMRGQIVPAKSAARRKLAIPLPDVFLASHSRVDPLPRVPAKMQHQVANRIFVRGAAAPN